MLDIVRQSHIPVRRSQALKRPRAAWFALLLAARLPAAASQAAGVEAREWGRGLVCTRVVVD